MLHFEKYKNSDYSDYYSLVKDDEVMKYITGKGMSAEEAEVKFESIIKINNEDELLGHFKVLNIDSNIIGECKLVRYKQDRSLFEVGYLLKKDYWGLGLGTEICANMIDLAFSFAPNNPIIGIIDPQNQASRKILESFGFKTYFKGIEDNIPTEKLILKR